MRQTEILQSRLKAERGGVLKGGAAKKFALIYPNEYRVGMSNLGLHVIYELINGRREFACERFFLPDGRLLDQMRRSREVLLSVETQTPLLRSSRIISTCLRYYRSDG